MSLPVATLGVSLEKTTALLDAKWIIDERGDTITFYDREEDNIQRDKYNSIKRKETVYEGYTMKAFPIQFNPIDKDLRAAGLREIVNVLLYTAMQDWSDLEIDPITLDITRSTIVLKNKTYKIKEKGFANHFSDEFLNVTFGLVTN